MRKFAGLLIIVLFLIFQVILWVEWQKKVNPCEGETIAVFLAACNGTIYQTGAIIGALISFLFIDFIFIAIILFVTGIYGFLKLSKDQLRREKAKKRIMQAIFVALFVVISFLTLNYVLSFFGLSIGGIPSMVKARNILTKECKSFTDDSVPFYYKVDSTCH